MQRFDLAVVALCAMAGTAHAGAFHTSITQSIFGIPYRIDFYRVAGDLAGSGPRLEPEGMTWYDGVLYVTGDAGAAAPPGSGSETNGYVAAYAGGNIAAAPTALGQYATGGRAIGAEGVTVNTRGSGFGAFTAAPVLVVGDSAGGSVGRILAALDTGSTAVVSEPFSPNVDDIAFVPGAVAADDRFAIIDDGTSPTSLRFYSTGAPFALLPGGFDLVPGAKGLTYLPPSQSSTLFPAATSGALLVAIKPDGAGLSQHELRLYGLDGALLTSSVLPTGVGSGLFGNIEALAFDPVGNRLFLGDESSLNSQIAVATRIPEPTSVALLVLAASSLAARRRGR